MFIGPWGRVEGVGRWDVEEAAGYLFNLDSDLCVAIVGGTGLCLPWSLRLMDDHFNVMPSVWSLPGSVTCLSEVCKNAPHPSVLCGCTVWSLAGVTYKDVFTNLVSSFNRSILTEYQMSS